MAVQIVDSNHRVLYRDAVAKCNVLSGENNINEFMPYAILTVANRIFYIVLFGMYFSDVQNRKGDSASGVTYRNGTIDTINATAFTVTGAALGILSLMSARNAWNFRSAVLKSDNPLEMKKSINSTNNIRGLKIGHTVIVALASVINGIFQLMGCGVFSSDAETKNRGVLYAKKTAIPAMSLLLSKNVTDCLVSTYDLAVCHRNISALRNTFRRLEVDESLRLENLRSRMVLELRNKQKSLSLSSLSTGLVSVGLSALIGGSAGDIPDKNAVLIFIPAATLGQLIPIVKFISKICAKKEKIPHLSEEINAREEDSLIQKESPREESGENDLIFCLAQDLDRGGDSKDLIPLLQMGLCGSKLSVSEEQNNGLEGVFRVL